MCAVLVIIVSNSTSSASLWSSATDGRSVAQKPIVLQRLRNRSRRSWSAAEQMPVQAGAQYRQIRIDWRSWILDVTSSHTFKMWGMTLFHATNCCHLLSVGAYASASVSFW